MPELRAPFGAADGMDFETRECSRGDASCLREAAQSEWLDLAETLLAQGEARGGYLHRVTFPDADAWLSFKEAALGDLPPSTDVPDEELAPTVGRVLRALVSRWPVALHKTAVELDEQVTWSSTRANGDPGVNSSWTQTIDGIAVAWDNHSSTLFLDEDWRPRSWTLPVPSEPLREWIRRFGPIPDIDETRRIVVSELPKRFEGDYSEDVFGSFRPETIDWNTVPITGPYWYWGVPRRSYAADFSYWRVAYSVQIYANFCEHYFVTAVEEPVLMSEGDAGLVSAQLPRQSRRGVKTCRPRPQCARGWQSMRVIGACVRLAVPLAPLFVACASDSGVVAADAGASRQGAHDGGMSDIDDDASRPGAEPVGTDEGADDANGDPGDVPGDGDDDVLVDDEFERDAGSLGANDATTEAGLPVADARSDEVVINGIDAAAGPTRDGGQDDTADADASLGCGDGVVGVGEACDEGPENDDEGHCTTQCAWAECGDGIVNGDEQCDDGNDYDLDDCVFGCLFNVCGDGYVNLMTEWCDDGNDDDFDTCPNDCSSETPCGDSFPSCAVSACGDGIIDPGEECDDQNVNDNDACRNDCTVSTQSDGG
jgi:cysteine-rich repeat protein